MDFFLLIAFVFVLFVIFKFFSTLDGLSRHLSSVFDRKVFVQYPWAEV